MIKEEKEKRFTILVDGNFSIGEMSLDSLKKYIEGNGFHIETDKIDEFMKKCDLIVDSKIMDDVVKIECDSIDFGQGNGTIEVMRIK